MADEGGQMCGVGFWLGSFGAGSSQVVLVLATTYSSKYMYIIYFQSSRTTACGLRSGLSVREVTD